MPSSISDFPRLLIFRLAAPIWNRPIRPRWSWRARRGRWRCHDLRVPQDIDYPALQLNVDRLQASELGLTSKEVVQNVITALTSDQMIAPSYWVDPNTGNDYLLTVQYREDTIKNLADL